MALTPKNNPLTNYFRTSYQELSRVAWPTRQQALKHTAVVIAFSLTLALFFAVIDYIFSLGLEQLITRF